MRHLSQNENAANEERELLSRPDCLFVTIYSIEPLITETISGAEDHPHHLGALDLATGHLASDQAWRHLQDRKALGVLKMSPLAAETNIAPLHSTGIRSAPIWHQSHVLALYRAARLYLSELDLACNHGTGVERGADIYDARRRWNATVQKISSASGDLSMQILLGNTSAWLRQLWGDRYDRPAPDGTATRWSDARPARAQRCGFEVSV